MVLAHIFIPCFKLLSPVLRVRYTATSFKRRAPTPLYAYSYSTLPRRYSFRRTISLRSRTGFASPQLPLRKPHHMLIIEALTNAKLLPHSQPNLSFFDILVYALYCAEVHLVMRLSIRGLIGYAVIWSYAARSPHIKSCAQRIGNLPLASTTSHGARHSLASGRFSPLSYILPIATR